MKQLDLDVSQLRNATLLVGSMISADQETGMASGIAVSNELIKRLCSGCLSHAPATFGLTASARDRIEAIAQDTPFEVALQHYPDDVHLQGTLIAECTAGIPNRYHRALSEAAQKGYISNVITTNYDLYIEKSDPSWNVVVDESDLGPARLASPGAHLLFKIHGCTSRRGTMAYRLAQEGRLPPWKQDLLLSLVDGQDVVVIGYSGRDFDVCPVLLRSNYRRLIWLFAGDSPLEEAAAGSHNVRFVHTSPREFPNVYAIGGGFDRFFRPTLEPGAPRFKPSTTAPAMIDRLFAGEAADPAAFAIWRGRFFQSIACPIGIDAALNTLAPAAQASSDALELRSALLERMGRYKQSNAVVRQWRKTIERTSKPNAWIDTFYVEAGRCYSAGNVPGFLRSRRRFRKELHRTRTESPGIDEDLISAQNLYLNLLAIKTLKKIPILRQSIRRMNLHRLSSAVAEAEQIRYRRGEWQDMHLIKVAAKELGIATPPGGNINQGDSDRLLEGVESFSQLNNVVGRASTARRYKDTQRKNCDEILEDLALIGHYGEMWKFYTYFIGDISKRHFVTYRELCLHSFLQCELYFPVKLAYGLRLRLQLWKFRRRRRGDIIPV